MKKSAEKGSFGAPKPLPGQAGYNVLESNVLEKEAKDMESRLQMLQDRMKQQQIDESKTAGSTKWKSSSKDKGSVSSYGKELQEKHKKRSEAEGGGDPVLRATATGRRMQRDTSVKTFRSQDVEFWSVTDVGEWLSYIQMGQYATIFAQNEINGLILLDVTLEDLDYMSITVLGHRKVILKGAEELRRNKRVSTVMSESLPATGNGLASVLRTQSASNMTKSADDTLLQDQTKQISPLSASSSGVIDTAAKTSTHWSQLEPLSNNKVSNRSGAVNAADDSDMIDEEAERLAFMEAVNQWRQQGPAAASEKSSEDTSSSGGRPKMKIEREYEKKKQTAAPVETQAQGSMWHNPFAAPQSKSSLIVDDSDEEGDAPRHQPSNNSRVAPSKTDPVKASPRGASQFDGTLDEAKEHEEFARAVEMWRNGGSTSAGGAQSGTKGLAAELAKQLEQEQQESVERLHKQRQDAEQRLQEANLDLDRMKRAAHQSQAKDSEEEEKASHSSSSPVVGMYTYSTPLSATKAGGSRGMQFDDEDDEDEDHLSTASTPRGDEAEQGHIEVALVESVLLNGVTTAGVDDLEESGCYVVEYESGDD